MLPNEMTLSCSVLVDDVIEYSQSTSVVQSFGTSRVKELSPLPSSMEPSLHSKSHWQSGLLVLE